MERSKMKVLEKYSWVFSTVQKYYCNKCTILKLLLQILWSCFFSFYGAPSSICITVDMTGFIFFKSLVITHPWPWKQAFQYFFSTVQYIYGAQTTETTYELFFDSLTFSFLFFPLIIYVKPPFLKSSILKMCLIFLQTQLISSAI